MNSDETEKMTLWSGIKGTWEGGMQVLVSHPLNTWIFYSKENRFSSRD